MRTFSVRNLEVEFAHPPQRRCTPSTASPSTSPRARCSAWSANPAPENPSPGLAVIGLIDPPGRIAGGEIYLSGMRIDNLPPEEIRRIRGKRIGMIFQDPLTSLNPLYRIGDQIVETIRTHLNLSETRGAQARHRPSGRGRHSRAGKAHRRLSA